MIRKEECTQLDTDVEARSEKYKPLLYQAASRVQEIFGQLEEQEETMNMTLQSQSSPSILSRRRIVDMMFTVFDRHIKSLMKR